MRWLLLAPLLLLTTCEPKPLEVVRFQLDHAVEVQGATPLFGDPAALRALAAPGAPDLSTWRAVETRSPAAMIRALEDAGARNVSLRPRFEPAAVRAAADALAPSCPVKTPPYDARQGYREALGMSAARDLPGGRGQGVQVADVEGEWNEAHEDLPGARMEHVAGRRMKQAGWRAHGTAVVGVLAARDNGVGMTGLVPDVERIYTASLGDIGAARAFLEVAKRLDAGDVLIVELHGPGPNWKGRGQKGFVPMEWWQPEFEAIKWAAAKGIVVVEAAGNGGEDLDDKVYKRRFDRRVRDSGAILVGAGAPSGAGAPARSRLGFSNYGARVDLQGWGGLVASLDYGDLQGCDAPSRKYTARFSGTSSASPVVAGAVLAVQGVFKARTGSPLAPESIRNVLRATGSPQVGGPLAPKKQQIGPLPHVGRALARLGLSP
jgi:subtilisin family serine protease